MANLILEYVLANAAVARSFSGYCNSHALRVNNFRRWWSLKTPIPALCCLIGCYDGIVCLPVDCSPARLKLWWHRRYFANLIGKDSSFFAVTPNASLDLDFWAFGLVLLSTALLCYSTRESSTANLGVRLFPIDFSPSHAHSAVGDVCTPGLAPWSGDARECKAS